MSRSAVAPPCGLNDNHHVDDVTVRYASDREFADAARLRWQWTVQENGKTPATSREEFIHSFVSWARKHASSHRWIIASRSDEIIGMACLAIVPRVPSPQSPRRASGDLQSVYVVPGGRSAGLGGQIVAAILSLAGDLGLERVTVHSSPRAVPAYSRTGFTVSPLLLQAETPFRAAEPG
jgi:GNAT superfamily N-acetyltransferase